MAPHSQEVSTGEPPEGDHSSSGARIPVLGWWPQVDHNRRVFHGAAMTMSEKSTPATPRTEGPPRPGLLGTSHDASLRSALTLSLGMIFNALVLAVDLTYPQQYATAILYTLPMLAAFWLPTPRPTIVLALAGSACSAVGYAMSPVGVPTGPMETGIYRAAALVVLWGTAFLAICHQNARMLMERSTIAGRHQAALLRAILQTTPDALVVIDEGGIIQSFSHSAQRMFGYAAEEAIGRNVSLLMPSSDRETHDDCLEHYLRTGERRIIGVGRVVNAQTKDGRLMPVELSVGEAALAGHRVFIGFMRDLSSRQRIEAELRQAQKMDAIGQLTGGIAHDFNNLLLVITGNLELIAAHPERLDTVALQEAREAAELAAELTAQLLAFGRKQPLDPKEVDVADLVKNVASMLRRTLGDHIELVVDIRGTPGKAVVDAAQLQTALINLALNARDAMAESGRIVMAIFETMLDASYAQQYPQVRVGPYVAIQIADNGAGMSVEVRERAFDPFFTTKTQGAGTGLGLSMVYGFVKQSEGHIEICSTVGRGTTVTLFLPRAAEEPRPTGAPAPTAADGGHGERVLVVEDDPRVRRMVVVRLSELGYNVIEAKNGPEALQLIRAAGPIDLLLSDVVMHDGMSGFELARLARLERPDLHILLTTGYADPDAVARNGGSRYRSEVILRKPYSKDQLARTVRHVLEAGA